jgi:signal transduction histidine kinase
MLAQTLGPDNLADKPRRYLQTITDASAEMGRLIDDLLAFSRSSRIELHPGRIDTGQLVQETLQRLDMETRGRNIDWRIPPLPAVEGDPALLRQVFTNLLGNAVKYTRGRDPAQIEIGSADAEGGHATFFVRDNGAGFDPRYAHKLFGVFQRLHRAEEFEGTGIGLAIVHRIVSRHGGRTWAEGRPGEGATFFFTLPKAAN